MTSPDFYDPHQNEGLWEQAVSDGASTGDFSGAHVYELRAKIATDAELIEERNDAAVEEIAFIGSQIPESIDEYLEIRTILVNISANTQFPTEISIVAHQCLTELAVEFPELHEAAMKELSARTTELITLSGLGNRSVKLATE